MTPEEHDAIAAMDAYAANVMKQASQSAQNVTDTTRAMAENMRETMRQLRWLRFKIDPYIIQEEP